MKTIEVTVNTKGETTVETRGFAGPACRSASEFLERALGKVSAERKTAGFYRAAGQTAEAKQHG